MYGSRIREMRKRRGLTLKEVAEATGYTIGHISQIERDLKSPSLVALRKIAACLNCSEVWLIMDEKKGFDSLYFMELKISADELKTQVAKIMQDPECGGIFRVKGFVKDDAGSWMQLNATGHEISMKPIGDGQEVVIVIGEQLKEDCIRKYLEN